MLCSVTARTSHKRLSQTRRPSLRLILAEVKVRDERIQQQQKAHAEQEAEHGRQPGVPAVRLRHLDSGDEQRPDRGGNHHARSKAEQRFLHLVPHLPFEKEHRRRAEHGARASGSSSPSSVLTVWLIKGSETADYTRAFSARC